MCVEGVRSVALSILLLLSDKIRSCDDDVASTSQRSPPRLRQLRSAVPLTARAHVQFQSPYCPAHQARSRENRSLQSMSVVLEALRHGLGVWKTSGGAQPDYVHSLPRSVSAHVSSPADAVVDAVTPEHNPLRT